MKYLILTFCLSLVIGLSSCSKECEPVIAACNETIPTDEACAAYFTRWIYDHKRNRCEQISYSGCSQVGFGTLKECEECKCK